MPLSKNEVAFMVPEFPKAFQLVSIDKAALDNREPLVDPIVFWNDVEEKVRHFFEKARVIEIDLDNQKLAKRYLSEEGLSMGLRADDTMVWIDVGPYGHTATNDAIQIQIDRPNVPVAFEYYNLGKNEDAVDALFGTNANLGPVKGIGGSFRLSEEGRFALIDLCGSLFGENDKAEPSPVLPERKRRYPSPDERLVTYRPS
jgi:hypothetical protein